MAFTSLRASFSSIRLDATISAIFSTKPPLRRGYQMHYEHLERQRTAIDITASQVIPAEPQAAEVTLARFLREVGCQSSGRRRPAISGGPTTCPDEPANTRSSPRNPSRASSSLGDSVLSRRRLIRRSKGVAVPERRTEKRLRQIFVALLATWCSDSCNARQNRQASQSSKKSGKATNCSKSQTSVRRGPQEPATQSPLICSNSSAVALFDQVS